MVLRGGPASCARRVATLATRRRRHQLVSTGRRNWRAARACSRRHLWHRRGLKPSSLHALHSLLQRRGAGFVLGSVTARQEHDVGELRGRLGQRKDFVIVCQVPLAVVFEVSNIVPRTHAA